MAIVFPSGGLDSLTNPVSTDTLNSPDHATQHSNANDAIEALQAGRALTARRLDFDEARQRGGKEHQLSCDR